MRGIRIQIVMTITILRPTIIIRSSRIIRRSIIIVRAVVAVGMKMISIMNPLPSRGFQFWRSFARSIVVERTSIAFTAGSESNAAAPAAEA